MDRIEETVGSKSREGSLLFRAEEEEEEKPARAGEPARATLAGLVPTARIPVVLGRRLASGVAGPA